jgi:peroxiredoxin
MRRCFFSFVTSVGALLACISVSAQTLALGGPVPDFEAIDIKQGRVFRLSEHKGEVIIVNFWASWCTPCQAEMPSIEAYYRKHQAEGLQVIAISMDSPKYLATVKKMAQGFSFFTAHHTQSKINGFGRIWRMPSTFVIDRQGVLRKNGHEGDPEVNTELLETLVTPLLRMPEKAAGKPGS